MAAPNLAQLLKELADAQKALDTFEKARHAGEAADRLAKLRNALTSAQRAVQLAGGVVPAAEAGTGAAVSIAEREAAKIAGRQALRQGVRTVLVNAGRTLATVVTFKVAVGTILV